MTTPTPPDEARERPLLIEALEAYAMALIERHIDPSDYEPSYPVPDWTLGDLWVTCNLMLAALKDAEKEL